MNLQTREHKLIEEIKRWTGDAGIGDDCAILPNGHLVTCDTLVEGTHFVTGQIDFADLGWKSVAVNISDVAAMAGRPRQLVVSLTMPKEFPHLDFQKLYQAMIDCARAYRCQIIGGDLTAGPHLVISITCLADVHEQGVLRRSSAKPGHVVVVTGDFGASAAGLRLLQEGNARKFAHLYEKHCRPKPRLLEAWALVSKTGAAKASLMDASDGLADALVQISRASGVGMEIDLDLVPIHDQTKEVAKMAGVAPCEWALYGGEDYELVGTVDPMIWHELAKDADSQNLFSAIGTVTDKQTVITKGAGKAKTELDLLHSFQHFS